MKRLSCTIAALLLCGPAVAGPNLIVNGSFEEGMAGLGSFSGWRALLGDDLTFVDSDGTAGTHYGQATDGRWSAFFGSSRSSGGSTITQSFSTSMGQRYVVSFDLANDNGGLAPFNEFDASVDGSIAFAVASLVPQDYVRESFVFFGTGATTSLSLGGFNDNGYFDLDKVMVTAVPEPGTLQVLAAGALALFGLSSRRKR